MDIRTESMNLPSYLEKLLIDEREVNLVYTKVQNTDYSPSDVSLCEKFDSILNITGSPLKVDLGNNDTVIETVLGEPVRNWTPQEETYHPITLSQARNRVNEYLQKMSDEKPIFALCDGTDNRNTIILGAAHKNNNFERIMVLALPLCGPEEIPFVVSQNIQQDFNIAENLFSQQFIKDYLIFGHNLKFVKSLESSEFNASVCIQTVSSSEESAIHELQIILQVIIGHVNSSVHHLWKELQTLECFLKLLSSSNNLPQKTNLCDDFMDFKLIISQMSDIIDDYVLKRNKEPTETLDLTNLRPPRVIDRLWECFKRSKDLDELRELFIILFHELYKKNLVLSDIATNNSKIATIINNISNGKTGMPHLTFNHSLELLIDLGLEKLKSDYTTIINFFKVTQSNLLQKWTQLNCHEACEPNDSMLRRFDLSQKNPITDLPKQETKFLYLKRMHAVVEFLLLHKKEINLTTDSSVTLSQTIYKELMDDSFNFNTLSLQEFKTGIDLTNYRFINKRNANSTTIEMNLKKPRSEVVVVFHFSQNPIVPNIKHTEDNGDIETHNYGQCYVTKLLKYVNTL